MIAALRELHRELGDVLAALERLAPAVATWQAGMPPSAPPEPLQ
jgi:hypothetical protein